MDFVSDFDRYIDIHQYKIKALLRICYSVENVHLADHYHQYL